MSQSQRHEKRVHWVYDLRAGVGSLKKYGFVALFLYFIYKSRSLKPTYYLTNAPKSLVSSKDYPLVKLFISCYIAGIHIHPFDLWCF